MPEPDRSEQRAAVERLLRRNATLQALLARARGLDLPDWYLTAGAVFQTVWNGVTGRAPEHGIRDYDLFYHDPTDLSWDAEDAAIRLAAEAFAGLPALVEVRNEARVHLWYEQKFGVSCPPYASSAAAIDSFAATACCVGIRLEPTGELRVHAPHGYDDLLALVLRPNPVLAPREVYEAKAARWTRTWPELVVLPWPDSAGADSGGRQSTSPHR
jgi:uncharacterized protein